MTQLQVEYHTIESLHQTLGCSRPEAENALRTGQLTPCNFGSPGTPSYLRRDLDRVADEIRDAKAAGRALPIWEDAKAVREKPAKKSDPTEIEFIPRHDDDADDHDHDDDDDPLD